MTRARDVANRTIVANSVGATELDLTDNYAFTGTISGAGSNIIEKIDMVCNGEAHVVNGTTYTPSNVTAAVALTDTHTVITGSSISYTAPSNATRVTYEFLFTINWEDTAGIFHAALRVDGTQITGSRQTPSYQGTYDNVRHLFKYTLPIGGTGSNTTGRQATWSSAKTLDVTARRYSSTYDGNLHELLYWDGATQSPVLIDQPVLTITAYR